MIYRATLSPDHGPLKVLFPFGYCRHHPTCSTYALDQLKTRMLPIALFKIFIRVASCHPFAKVSDEKIRATIKEREKALGS